MIAHTEFLFTIEDIKRIYDAGVKRGEHQSSAYEWGASPSGGYFDECIDELHDIVTECYAKDDESRVDYDTVKEWFKENK